MSDKIQDTADDIRLVPLTPTAAAAVEKTVDTEDDFEIKLKTPTISTPPAAAESAVTEPPVDDTVEIKLSIQPTAAENNKVDSAAVPSLEEKENSAELPAAAVPFAEVVEKTAEKTAVLPADSAPSLFDDVEVKIKTTEKDIPMRAILLPEPPPPAKSKKGLVLFIILLLLIGGGCYVYFMQRSWFDCAVEQVKIWCGLADVTAENAADSETAPAAEASEKAPQN